jgi:SHS2 domain-containing protein
MFDYFEHTADLGLRVTAISLEELLTESARGLLAMLLANPDAVRPVQERVIHLGAEDSSYLLFDWLSELLYAFETDKLLFSAFDLKLENKELSAICRGEPMDPSRHQMEHEVKAITYHGLKVEQTGSSWQAEVIVDI